jgi:excisionase family DNA binding protein
MQSERWLTTRDVTDALRVTPATVYRLVRAEALPAVRVGGQWRFRRADLDAWLSRDAAVARTREDAVKPGRRGHGVAATVNAVLTPLDAELTSWRRSGKWQRG